MTEWKMADCFDHVGREHGDLEALVQGDRVVTWGELTARAHAVGAWLLERGLEPGAKVGLYTYNHPAYMEGTYAALAAGLIPFNVNYRYRRGELEYLLEDADAEALVVHEDLLPLLSEVRSGLTDVRAALVIPRDGSAPDEIPREADSYEAVASSGRSLATPRRSHEDFLFLYTGGTTGMPKGVMWRQQELFERLSAFPPALPPQDWAAFVKLVRDPDPIRPRTLIAPPLMHGTGWFTALRAWVRGGSVVLLENVRHFDAVELCHTVARARPTNIAIVGDAFAKPIVEALRGEAKGVDFSSVRMISSAGVMWSQEVKERLLEFNSAMSLLDYFSSSEAIGMGRALTTSEDPFATARFELSEHTRLFDGDLNLLETKPGTRGLVGVGGPQPIGYYKDPEKTARTFVETEVGRFSIPGDWARVNDDGKTLTLLGRGSVCINTGGEKVFPEEVETALNAHPDVDDSVVVGVPDPKWGEAVTALVSAKGDGLDIDALTLFVKSRIATYKAPKHILVVDEVYRSPAGKVDFAAARRTAIERLRGRA